MLNKPTEDETVKEDRFVGSSLNYGIVLQMVSQLPSTFWTCVLSFSNEL